MHEFADLSYICTFINAVQYSKTQYTTTQDSTAQNNKMQYKHDTGSLWKEISILEIIERS
jgi:hypothetical protein